MISTIQRLPTRYEREEHARLRAGMRRLAWAAVAGIVFVLALAVRP